MKMFKLNIITVLILLLVLGLGVALPSFFVQSIWNSVFEKMADRDLTIALWQASLLWGSVICLLYITGLFRFKIDFKTLDNIDISEVNDPALREKIQKLRREQEKDDQSKK